MNRLTLSLLLLVITMTLTSCSVIRTTFSVIKTTYRPSKGRSKARYGLFEEPINLLRRPPDSCIT